MKNICKKDKSQKYTYIPRGVLLYYFEITIIPSLYIHENDIFSISKFLYSKLEITILCGGIKPFNVTV